MTDRRTVDTINDDQLSQLYDDLDRARQELADRAEAESADAATGSYAGRAERVEKQRDQLAALVRDFLDPDPCRLDHHGYCQAHSWMCGGSRCPHARAREVLAALGEEPAIAQPGRWLHIAFTSPDETTTNTSALNLRDHLAAEFDGVSMRISSNAVEAGKGQQDVLTPGDPDPFGYEERERTGRNAGLDVPAATEATDIETTARILAAEETVTRVIDLYEQWVKAGPPPLGVSTARWWDRRLVELHDAIHTPTEQPARATPNNPAGA